MRSYSAALLAVVLSGDAAVAGHRSPEENLAEVMYLLESGVPVSVIRAYVEAEDLRFALTAHDLVALSDVGAEEGLLLILLERSQRAGEPVELEGATVVYEAKGVRALRKKDSTGKEVLVVTNLDENGLRLDRPPDLPPDVPPGVPNDTSARPVPAPEAEAPNREELEPPGLEASLKPTAPPAAPGPPEPSQPPRLRDPRGRVYLGPFYQFIPSNVPGPGSPWSPVFQILPTPWGWPFVSIYPHFALTPIYSFYGLYGSYGLSGRSSCYGCLH